MSEFQRLDCRKTGELRNVKFETGIAPYAAGAVLASFGNTRVICAVTFEKRVPRWMTQQGVNGGWITAEYSMLPYSTLYRKARDSTRGKIDGRTIEIQRLIGRSLRAVADLRKLPASTLWLDCDVLQADGGTRTVSITGAYVAARLAVDNLIRSGALKENPFLDSIAAVSVGICDGTEILDLNYAEDKVASVDFNVVMSGSLEFVELQGSGEEGTFSQRQLESILSLARKGISEITEMQNNILARFSLPASNSDTSSQSFGCTRAIE